MRSCSSAAERVYPADGLLPSMALAVWRGPYREFFKPQRPQRGLRPQPKPPLATHNWLNRISSHKGTKTPRKANEITSFIFVSLCLRGKINARNPRGARRNRPFAMQRAQRRAGKDVATEFKSVLLWPCASPAVQGRLRQVLFSQFSAISAISAVKIPGLRRSGLTVLGQLKRTIAELGVQVKTHVNIPPLQSLTPRANVARRRQQRVHVKQQIDL